MRVVNTPYAMLFHTEAKTYWLQGAETWFSATDWRGMVARPSRRRK
jgi:hypothetical protein